MLSPPEAVPPFAFSSFSGAEVALGESLLEARRRDGDAAVDVVVDDDDDDDDDDEGDDVARCNLLCPAAAVEASGARRSTADSFGRERRW